MSFLLCLLAVTGGSRIALSRQEWNLTAVEKLDFSLEERGEDTADVLPAAFKDFQCK